MSRLIPFGDAGYVAEIKYNHIANIVKQAEKCPNITRIMLFGSSTEERCTDRSDIDIAVFGKKQKSRYYTSKEYRDFKNGIFDFDLLQDYDILYFVDGKEYHADIMSDINNGISIYNGGNL